MGNESDTNAEKEPIQIVTDATAEHLSRIASIITTAVRDVAHEVGSWVKEVAEARSTEPPAPQPAENPAENPADKPAEKPAED